MRLLACVGSLIVAAAAGAVVARPWPPPPPAVVVSSPEILRVTVTRSAFEAMWSDASTVARAARIVPWLDGGVCRGFKLFAIRPGSPLAILGLRNGDAIRRVQGVDLTDTRHMGRLYDLVRSTKPSFLAVDLVRRGRSLALWLEVVDQ